MAIIHEGETGGFWAEVPTLPGCATHGETMDELLFNLREAVEGWRLTPPRLKRRPLFEPSLRHRERSAAIQPSCDRPVPLVLPSPLQTRPPQPNVPAGSPRFARDDGEGGSCLARPRHPPCNAFAAATADPQFAGPAITPISQPSLPISSDVGRPKALPASRSVSKASPV